jgi:hypothetical protein
MTLLRWSAVLACASTERDDVEEYSVAEGWIRVQAGKARDRRGNPMTLKIKGVVEPYFLELKNA